MSNSYKIKAVIITIYSFFIITTGLYSVNYYLNDNDQTGDIWSLTGGDDTADGLSTLTPKATFSNLFNTYIIDQGDTVYIDTGYYYEAITIFRSGTKESNVCFIGAGTNRTIIDTQNSNTFSIRITGADYIVIKHITVKNTMENGIYIYRSDHCQIISNLSYSNNWQGIKLGERSRSNIIKYNTAKNNRRGIQDQSSDWIRGGYNQIMYNNLFDNLNYGIGINPTTTIYYNIVMYNTCHNNGYDGIFIENAGTMYCGYNLCYNNGANGIAYKDSSDCIMFNNILYGNGTSFATFRNGIDIQENTSALVINNTCISNRDSGIRIKNTGNGRFKNNITSHNRYSEGGYEIDNQNAFNITVSNCCINRTYNNIILDPSSITNTPLFKNETLNQLNLNLSCNSPAKGKGFPNSVPNSMGAHSSWIAISNAKMSSISSFTVFFQTPFGTGSIPGDALIQITFPSEFDISSIAMTSPNCTTSYWGGFSGSFNIGVNGQTALINRTSGNPTIFGQTENLIFTGISNILAGTNYSLNIRVQKPDGVTIGIFTSNDFEIWSDVTEIGIVKSISNVILNQTNSTVIPGASILYKISYYNIGYTEGENIIIYDRLSTFVKYNTNLTGTASGWQIEWSTNNNPDQSWNSTDYSNVLDPSIKGNVKWIRWVKSSVNRSDQDKTLIYKVVIK